MKNLNKNSDFEKWNEAVIEFKKVFKEEFLDKYIEPVIKWIAKKLNHENNNIKLVKKTKCL